MDTLITEKKKDLKRDANSLDDYYQAWDKLNKEVTIEEEKDDDVKIVDEKTYINNEPKTFLNESQQQNI